MYLRSNKSNLTTIARLPDRTCIVLLNFREIMMARAEASGIRLSSSDAAIVKGMIARGDRQHDIAAWFGVNGGRIGEISSGSKFGYVAAAPVDQLPEPGPYLSGRSAQKAVAALEQAKAALEDALANIDEGLASAREYDQE